MRITMYVCDGSKLGDDFDRCQGQRPHALPLLGHKRYGLRWELVTDSDHAEACDYHACSRRCAQLIQKQLDETTERLQKEGVTK